MSSPIQVDSSLAQEYSSLPKLSPYSGWFVSQSYNGDNIYTKSVTVVLLVAIATYLSDFGPLLLRSSVVSLFFAFLQCGVFFQHPRSLQVEMLSVLLSIGFASNSLSLSYLVASYAQMSLVDCLLNRRNTFSVDSFFFIAINYIYAVHPDPSLIHYLLRINHVTIADPLMGFISIYTLVATDFMILVNTFKMLASMLVIWTLVAGVRQLIKYTLYTSLYALFFCVARISITTLQFWIATLLNLRVFHRYFEYFLVAALWFHITFYKSVMFLDGIYPLLHMLCTAYALLSIVAYFLNLTDQVLFNIPNIIRIPRYFCNLLLNPLRQMNAFSTESDFQGTSSVPDKQDPMSQSLYSSGWNILLFVKNFVIGYCLWTFVLNIHHVYNWFWYQSAVGRWLTFYRRHSTTFDRIEAIIADSSVFLTDPQRLSLTDNTKLFLVELKASLHVLYYLYMGNLKGINDHISYFAITRSEVLKKLFNQIDVKTVAYAMTYTLPIIMIGGVVYQAKTIEAYHRIIEAFDNSDPDLEQIIKENTNVDINLHAGPSSSAFDMFASLFQSFGVKQLSKDDLLLANQQFQYVAHKKRELMTQLETLQTIISVVCRTLFAFDPFDMDYMKFTTSMLKTVDYVDSARLHMNDLVTDKEFQSEVLTLYDDACKLNKNPRMETIPSFARSNYMRTFKILAELAEGATQMLNGDFRMEPFGLMLTGPPTTGKSALLKFLFASWCYLEGIKYDSTKVYPFNPQDQYFEGYNNQMFFLMDEMLKDEDLEKRNLEAGLVVKLINTAICPLNAAFESKGKLFFNSQVVAMTTNTANDGIGKAVLQLGLRDEGAFRRRLHLVLHKETLFCHGMDIAVEKFRVDQCIQFPDMVGQWLTGADVVKLARRCREKQINDHFKSIKTQDNLSEIFGPAPAFGLDKLVERHNLEQIKPKTPVPINVPDDKDVEYFNSLESDDGDGSVDAQRNLLQLKYDVALTRMCSARDEGQHWQQMIHQTRCIIFEYRMGRVGFDAVKGHYETFSEPQKRLLMGGLVMEKDLQTELSILDPSMYEVAMNEKLKKAVDNLGLASSKQLNAFFGDPEKLLEYKEKFFSQITLHAGEPRKKYLASEIYSPTEYFKHISRMVLFEMWGEDTYKWLTVIFFTLLSLASASALYKYFTVEKSSECDVECSIETQSPSDDESRGYRQRYKGAKNHGEKMNTKSRFNTARMEKFRPHSGETGFYTALVNTMARSVVFLEVSVERDGKIVATSHAQGVHLTDGFFITSAHYKVPFTAFDDAIFSIVFLYGKTGAVKKYKYTWDEIKALDIEMHDMIIFKIMRNIDLPRPMISAFVDEQDSFVLQNGSPLTLLLMGPDGVVQTRSLTKNPHASAVEYVKYNKPYKISSPLCYNGHTRVGMSGAPLLWENRLGQPQVLGIHTGSEKPVGGSLGIAIPVTRQSMEYLIDDLEAILEPKWHRRHAKVAEPVTSSIGVTKVGDVSVPLFQTQANFEGWEPFMPFAPDGLAPEFAKVPTKNKIRQAPMWGFNGPPKRIPAKLHNHTNPETGEEIKPMYLALTKMCKEPWDWDVPENVMEYMRGHYRRPTTPLTPLTWLEAINGIPGKIPAINMQSSSGYQWNKGADGKFPHLFRKPDGTLDYEPSFLQHCMHLEAKLLAGENFDVFWQDLLKTETLPTEKVKKGKARIFTSSQLPYTIIVRKYTLQFLAAVQARAGKGGPIGVGINPHSDDWFELWDVLNSTSGSVVSGDFTRWDGKVPRSSVQAYVRFMNWWYNDGPIFAKVRELLFYHVYHATHVYLGWTFVTQSGIPSGHANTATMSSFCNCIQTVNILMNIMKLLDNMFHLVTYGDDIIITAILKGLKSSDFSPHYKKLYDMTFTHWTKESSDVTDTLSDIRFIGRKFVESRSHMCAPLDIDVILGALYWYSGSPINKEAVMISTLKSVFQELGHFTREEYDHYTGMILDWILDHMGEEYYNNARAECPTWWSLWQARYVPGKAKESGLYQKYGGQTIMYEDNTPMGFEFHTEANTVLPDHEQVQVNRFSTTKIRSTPRVCSFRYIMDFIFGLAICCFLMFTQTQRFDTESSLDIDKPRFITTQWKHRLTTQKYLANLLGDSFLEAEIFMETQAANGENSRNTQFTDIASNEPPSSQNVPLGSFHDATPITTTGSSGFVLQQPHVPTNMQTFNFNEILDREFLLYNGTWSTTQAAGTDLVTLDFPGDLFAQPFIADKIKNFRYFKGGVELSIRVSGSRFNSGRLLLDFQPCTYGVAATNTTRQRSGSPHVLISASASEAVVFQLPFVCPYRAVTTSSPVNFMGQSTLHILNPLQDINGAVNTAQIFITGRFLDAKLFLPQDDIAALLKKSKFQTESSINIVSTSDKGKESRFKSASGTVSSAFEVASSIFGGVVKVANSAAPYANMFQVGSSTAATAMRVIGLNKPSSIRTTEVVTVNPNMDLNTGKGIDTAPGFSMDPENAISTAPVVGGISQDEMALSHIVGTPMLQAVVSFNKASVDPVLLATIGPDPIAGLYTYVDWISLQFQFYTGSYKFKFYITASLMQSARIVVYLAAFVTDDWQQCYHQVLDIEGDTEYAVTVPFLQQEFYNGLTTSDYALYGKVLSWSQPNPTPTINIYFNVYKAGGSDFRVGGQLQRQFVGSFSGILQKENEFLDTREEHLKQQAAQEGFQTEANPRFDFQQDFQPIHPSCTGTLPENLIHGEEFTTYREMIHRYYPYRIALSGTTYPLWWKDGTVLSPGHFLGVEMLGLIFRFWRGTLRFRTFINSNRPSMARVLYDTDLVSTTYTNASQSAQIEFAVPYYNNGLFNQTRASSYYEKTPLETVRSSAGANNFYFKSCGDDFSFHWLCAPPIGTLGPVLSSVEGNSGFSEWIASAT